MDWQKIENIVVLSGAGISADSGIKTFRDANGLWENHRIEDVASPQGFARNKKLVYDFYNQRRRQLQGAEIAPNKAHVALAQFEEKFKGKFTLISQNIDDLHERAGSKNILKMHGDLLKARCIRTGDVSHWTSDFNEETPCPCCQKKGFLRPHIVWFGEMPFFMEEIMEALEQCQLFAAIGTSGEVYPASMFVQTARKFAGAHTVEFNLGQSKVSKEFHQTIEGKAAVTVPEFFKI